MKKQRHYFANQVPSSQSYGFSSSHVWMWELDYKESWCQRIDAFELWCWRRLLRVPWTARRSNQSILKKICPEYSLEVLSKLQGLVMDREAWHAAVHRQLTKSCTQLSNWTELNWVGHASSVLSYSPPLPLVSFFILLIFTNSMVLESFWVCGH